MSRSFAQEKYWEALERIQSENTLIVNTNEPGFRISNLTVALEAGKAKPKGYIRPLRFPELCAAIKAAHLDRLTSFETSATKRQKLDSDKKQAMSAKYKELRNDYEKLLEQYLNVVKENFELKTHISTENNSKKRI
ncbi:hypothetical protein ACED29_17250 [Shewanella sp. 5S214]|uniref:hypothetical protein n=1 Tax=Shewanella sp. 5S214 TaxID=3229999 RepID=UPI00352F3248